LTEQRHLREQVAKSTDQLRRLATRLQTVQEEERTQLSREIHDELGGALTALKMDLAHLARRLPDAPADIQNNFVELGETISRMIKMLRRIATDLRPAILDDFGLVEAIEWQLGDFETRSGLACRFVSQDTHISLSPEK